MTREQREAKLLEMTWQAIKAIAEPLSIPKPAGGWDEAIPLILDFEFPDIEEVEEVDQGATEEAVELQPVTETSTIFSTNFFEESGIPYCKTCGASYQNDLAGMPVCPVSATDCDRLR